MPVLGLSLPYPTNPRTMLRELYDFFRGFPYIVVDAIYLAVRTNLPELPNMTAYLDHILPKVRRYSEGIHETEFYVDMPWVDVVPEEQRLEKVVHIFKPDQTPGEITAKDEDQGSAYMLVTEGNIIKGKWSFLNAGSLIIKVNQRYELYDLSFLNDDFLVLKKNKDENNLLDPTPPNKYLFLVKEKLAVRHTWRELMELLFDVYRYNLAYMVMWIMVIFTIGGVAYLSFR
jgi:hypothetical protein